MDNNELDNEIAKIIVKLVDFMLSEYILLY